jgi:hypothetical protein
MTLSASASNSRANRETVEGTKVDTAFGVAPRTVDQLIQPLGSAQQCLLSIAVLSLHETTSDRHPEAVG